jgi:acyl-CoA reductase-like NAD-dependent aldehyde dehydrogenase
LKKGAKVVTGGKRAAQDGSFFERTVLTDVTTDMVITMEETFGPAAPLYRFKSEADAVKLANDAPTLPSPARGGGSGRGASYLYSRDIGRIWRVTGARNTASRNSSNTSAWAASTDECLVIDAAHYWGCGGSFDPKREPRARSIVLVFDMRL